MAINISGPVNFNQNEAQNARAHNLGAAPGTPKAGQFYYNTNDGFVYVWDGNVSNWRQLVTLTQLFTVRLDQLAAPNAALNLNNQRLTSLANPVNPQDAATMGYVDAAINGLKWKDVVRVATTANITLSGTQTIDTISIAAGERVAVIAQTDASKNGIYVAASGAWVRAVDADTAAEVLGMTFFVSEGSTNGNRVYTMTTDAPITLGTTGLVFAQIGGSVTYGAGTGIVISGNTIAIDMAIVARKRSGTIGDGSATSLPFTHNLGVKAVTVGLRKVSTDEHWLADVTSSTVNAVTLSFATAPAANEFEVVVIG